jgi:lipopolysaccharide transport system permease protein
MRFAAVLSAAATPVLGERRGRKLVGYLYATLVLLYSNLRAQYGKTLLGVLWTVLTPFLFLAIYVPLFSYYMGSSQVPTERLGEGRLALPVFVLSGFVVWVATSESITASAASLVSNVGVVQHSPIPLSVLPFVKVLQSMLGLAFSMAMLLVFLAVVGRWPGASVLLLVPTVVLLALFLFGVALALSALTIYFRDLLQLIGTFLLLEFFAAPIGWVPPHPLTGITGIVIGLNPLTPYLNLMRGALIEKWPVDVKDFGLAIGWSLVAVVVGSVVFEKLKTGIPERA